jgi:hypothetical protein
MRYPSVSLFFALLRRKTASVHRALARFVMLSCRASRAGMVATAEQTIIINVPLNYLIGCLPV